MWQKIKQLIYNNHHFLITTHLNPDGDGIGAASALSELLIQMGKTVRFVSDSPIPHKFQFLDYHGVFEVYDPEKDYSQVEVIIILDTNRLDRIGKIGQLMQRSGLQTVCIDHHPIEKPFTTFTVIDSSACSTGAMVYTLFSEMGFDIDIISATGIYASIICDTGRFSYASTTEQAHQIAQKCIHEGVDPDTMYAKLFQHIPLAQVKIFAKVLDRMEMYFNNRVLVQVILQEDYHLLRQMNADEESLDFEYMFEFDKCIEEVECIVLLREQPNRQVRVSMRSLGNLDILPLMKQFGGGGHQKAAGATCQGSLAEIKQQLLAALESTLPKTSPNKLIVKH